MCRDFLYQTLLDPEPLTSGPWFQVNGHAVQAQAQATLARAGQPRPCPQARTALGAGGRIRRWSRALRGGRAGEEMRRLTLDAMPARQGQGMLDNDESGGGGAQRLRGKRQRWRCFGAPRLKYFSTEEEGVEAELQASSGMLEAASSTGARRRPWR
jgi:hypothetical protein